MSDGCDLAIGLLMGALLGAGAALLFAPQSGRETRERLGEEGRRLRTRATDVASEYERRGREAYARARTTFDDTARGLKEAGRILVEPTPGEIEAADAEASSG